MLSLSIHGYAQVDWNGNGGDGLWDTAANWTSSPALPGSSDDVFNHTNQSITHNSGTDTINSFLSDGTGALYLTGGTLAGSQANSASTFQVDGIFSVDGGGLSNLTINPGSGGQGVSFSNNGSNSISNVIFNSNVDLSSNSSAYVQLYGANTLNGTTTLATSNGLQLYNSNASLTIGSNGILQGYGNIYQSYGGGTLINNGAINANSSANTLEISTDNFTNNGLAEATNGATLLLANNVTLTNNGILTAGVGGQIDIRGTYTGGSSGTLNQVGSGQILVDGALNGSLNVTGTLGLTFNGSGNNALNGNAITGNLDFATYGNAYALLTGGVTFDQGTLNLATSQGLQLLNSNTSLTIGSNGIVQGYGNIYEAYGGTTLTNNGIINANISAQTLALATSNFTNNGLLEATNGGILLLETYNPTTNNGTLTADNSLIHIQGGTFTAGANSQLIQQGTGQILVDGATLNGPLSVTGALGLTFNGSGNNILNGNAITGNLDFATYGNAYAFLTGGVTFDQGTLNLATSQGLQLRDSNASLTIGSNGIVQGYGNIEEYYGGATLTNNGTLNANIAGQTLTISTGNFINNTTTTASNGATLFLPSISTINNGTLTADNSLIHIQGGTFTAGANSQLIQQGTGQILVDGATINGPLAISGTTGLTFNGSGNNILNGNAITGNLDFATYNNAYAFLTGGVTFDQGTLNLATSQGLQLRDSNASLTIGSNGIVQGYGNIEEYYGGTTLTNNGTLNANIASQTLAVSIDNVTNAGKVNVAAGSTLTVSSTLNQTGGNTNADGTLQANGGVSMTGGTLTGTGTVEGNVTNSGGTVRPGDLLGALSIAGSYTQSIGGTTEIDLGGVTPGTYGQLNVSGLAQLGGELAVKVVPGFMPTVGETFDFLTYGTLSGTYNSLVALDPGYSYSLSFSGDNGILTVDTIGSSSVPETSTFVTAGLMLGAGGLLLRRRRARA
jgi:fibronectin-binding autotransporter adhesin